jgi:hypothetical protein
MISRCHGKGILRILAMTARLQNCDLIGIYVAVGIHQGEKNKEKILTMFKVSMEKFATKKLR